MTQSLMSWQGPMEPVLICSWDGHLRLGNWGVRRTMATIDEVNVLELIRYWGRSQKIQSVMDVAMLE